MTLRSVYSIDSGMPFARDVAKGIIDLAVTPERLSKAIILVPSRRAAIALKAAFFDISDGVAMLLPQIKPIGDFSDDNSVNDADSCENIILEIEADLPPPISALRRQIILTKLLRHFPLGGRYPSHPQAMLLANSLAQLLDQFYNVDATVDQLAALFPEKYSLHWQDITALLKILIKRWPDLLRAEGKMDAVDRRNQLLLRVAKAWEKKPPKQLVVVAGSTGSISATRALIEIVSKLPDGHVVLPGLDRSAKTQWKVINNDPGHPQYQLAQLLNYLEMEPDEVKDWVAFSKDFSRAVKARRKLMREVFRPAALSAFWQRLAEDQQIFDRAALDGLKIITARDKREEASLLALLLREVLNDPKKTAALVTPDRQLAQLVSAELGRWKIKIDDSAGQRLGLTPVGRFLQLLGEALASNFAPIPVLSLLKHPFSRGGTSHANFRLQIDRIERAAFRGMSPKEGIAGLFETIDEPDLKKFVERHIFANLVPLISLSHKTAVTLSDLAIGLAEAAELLASDEIINNKDGGNRESGAMLLWRDTAGEVASDLLREMSAQGLDDNVLLADIPQILRQMVGEKTVQLKSQPNSRLAILGAVEARMHPAQIVGEHRIILAGFNEGNWPPREDADPWMNASMRDGVGLPPRNWRVGLSAHDVYMAACSPDIVITRSEKDGGIPTIKSRWLQRFEVVLSALALEDALDTGKKEAAWLEKLAPLVRPNPAKRPVPCPPLKARPRSFSATEIDALVADPFVIYSKKILGLKPLEPVDQLPNAALRGNIFHESLARFIRENPKGLVGKDALAELLAIGQVEFNNQIGKGPIKAFWWPRFKAMATWFIETEAQRRQTVSAVYAETSGKINLLAPLGLVILSARADRLERDNDGNWTIVDYKTGVIPSLMSVRNGLSNQLAVEGLIAEEGGFGSLPPGKVRALEYWQIGGNRSTPGEIKLRLSDDFDAVEKRKFLEELVGSYDDPKRGYPSEPNPNVVLSFNPYEHLSRSREWRNGGGCEE